MYVESSVQFTRTSYRDAQAIFDSSGAGQGGAGGSKSKGETTNIVTIPWRRSSGDDLEGAVELEMDVVGQWFGGHEETLVYNHH